MLDSAPLIPWFQMEALQLGPVTVQTFGLLVGVGILLGIRAAHARARRTGVDPRLLSDFIAHTLTSGLFFGHALNTVFYYPEALLSAPWELLMPWKGQSSFGGFFGAIFGAFLWKMRRKIPLMPCLDACAYGMPIAWLLGRTACFLTHDHPGQVSQFFLAVRDYQYGAPPFAPRHDLGLYELLWSLGCIALFHTWQKKQRPPGFFIAMLAILYTPVRFALDFLRVDDATYLFGLTPGHFASLLAFGLGVWVLQQAQAGRWLTAKHARHV